MNTYTDPFGEVDLSSDPRSGRIGCMTRRLADLNAEERRLLAQLRFVRAARAVALKAVDHFLSAPARAGE